MPRGKTKARQIKKGLNAKVSILIPVFNRQSLIEEALTSVVRQTMQDWQCIIWDDGSTDETAWEIERYIQSLPKHLQERFIVRSSEFNQGQGHARKRLIELWKKNPTPWACWLDSDDKLASTRLDKQLKLAETNKLDVVFGDLEFFWSGRRDTKRRRIDISKYTHTNYMSVNNNTNTATAFFNMKAGKLVTKQAPINNGNWDGLWHWQLIRNDLKMGYVYETVYYCRHHEGRIVRRRGTNAWLIEQPVIKSEYKRITAETEAYWIKKAKRGVK